MLKFNLPSLARRDFYNIWKGSFRLKNLVYLQVHSSRPDLSNMAINKNRKFVLKRPTTSRKVYENKEVWFTKFTNYIVIISTLCICLTNLYIRILFWINKIYNYSTIYNQTSILDLTLNYYGYIMDCNQLKSNNWDMLTQFKALYCQAANIKAQSQGFKVHNIALKRL